MLENTQRHKEKAGTLTSNYIYNLGNQMLISLMPLITAPYVSRVLGVEKIGHYSFAQSIASYFAMVAVLGTSLYGQRKIAQYRDNSAKRSRIFWEIVLLRLLLTVTVFAIYYAAIVFKSEEWALYLAVSLEILGVCFDVSWFFQGIEEFQSITACNAISKLICAIGIFTLVKSQKDIVIYAALYGCSLGLGYAFLWKYVPQKVEKVKITKLHPLSYIQPAVILFISQVAIQIYTVLDKTMIGLLTNSDEQNGYYEQSQKLIRVLVALVTSVGTVMASRVANLWINQKEKEIQGLMEKSFRLVYAVSFPIMFGVILVATRFVPFFYGEGYSGVITLLYILAVLLPVIASSNVIGIQYLVPTGQERYLTLSVTIGAAVNFLCNLFLIPNFLANGAAIGSVIAEFCVTIVQLFIVRKQLLTLRFLKMAVHYFALGIPMFIIGNLTSRLLPMNMVGMVILIVEGIGVYFITLLIARDSFMQDALRGNIF